MASPDTIRVAAVTGIFAPVPGHVATHGGLAELIGRRIDHDAIRQNSSVRMTDGLIVLGNLEECYPPDPAHNSTFGRLSHGTAVLNSIRKLIRDGDIVAGDAATATWAGVPVPSARIDSTQARTARRHTSPEEDNK